MIRIAKKKKYPKMKRGSSATKKDVRKIKTEIKSWRKPDKKPKQKKRKQKKKYLINLKREKALASKDWKVARTTGYLKQPKKAIGKKGYPYAVLNKESHYETFYTWKEKKKKKSKKRK